MKQPDKKHSALFLLIPLIIFGLLMIVMAIATPSWQFGIFQETFTGSWLGCINARCLTLIP